MKHLWLFLFGCAALGCHTNVDEFIPYPVVPNAGERFSGNFFTEVTTSATIYPMNAERDTLIAAPDGTQVEYVANALLDAAGNPATGIVELWLNAQPNLGNRIRHRRISLDETGALIAANGQIELRFRQNGQALELREPGLLSVRLPDADLTVAGAQAFAAAAVRLPNEVRLAGWQAMPGVPLDMTAWPTQSGEVEGWQLQPESLGWWQTGAYVDSAIPRTTLCAAFEPSYAAENTVVFALFTELRAVVELYDADADGIFCLDNLPIGQSVDYLSISEKADDTYELAVFTSTTEAQQRVDLVPAPRSLGGILDVLGNY